MDSAKVEVYTVLACYWYDGGVSGAYSGVHHSGVSLTDAVGVVNKLLQADIDQGQDDGDSLHFVELSKYQGGQLKSLVRKYPVRYDKGVDWLVAYGGTNFKFELDLMETMDKE